MFFRMLFGLPGAALVTAFLFVAMAWMIRQDATILPPVETPEFSILARLKPTEPKPSPPRPTTPDQPEPPVIDFPEPSDNPGGAIPMDLPPGPTGKIGVLDFPTGMQPTVRIPPSYPQACRSRGAQGVVIVEFDVTAEGEVINPRIVSSANACFDRTVLTTVQKWKYPPKQGSDGRPAIQRGVRESFNFQLTE